MKRDFFEELKKLKEVITPFGRSGSYMDNSLLP